MDSPKQDSPKKASPKKASPKKTSSKKITERAASARSKATDNDDNTSVKSGRTTTRRQAKEASKIE